MFRIIFIVFLLSFTSYALDVKLCTSLSYSCSEIVDCKSDDIDKLINLSHIEATEKTFGSMIKSQIDIHNDDITKDSISKLSMGIVKPTQNYKITLDNSQLCINAKYDVESNYQNALSLATKNYENICISPNTKEEIKKSILAIALDRLSLNANIQKKNLSKIFHNLQIIEKSSNENSACFDISFEYFPYEVFLLSIPNIDYTWLQFPITVHDAYAYKEHKQSNRTRSFDNAKVLCEENNMRLPYPSEIESIKTSYLNCNNNVCYYVKNNFIHLFPQIKLRYFPIWINNESLNEQQATVINMKQKKGIFSQSWQDKNNLAFVMCIENN